MKKIENECVDCGLPCLGSSCPNRNIKRYKLYLELKKENMGLIVKDIVKEPFDLKLYIFHHDFEKYDITKFILKEVQK